MLLAEGCQHCSHHRAPHVRRAVLPQWSICAASHSTPCQSCKGASQWRMHAFNCAAQKNSAMQYRGPCSPYMAGHHWLETSAWQQLNITYSLQGRCCRFRCRQACAAASASCTEVMIDYMLGLIRTADWLPLEKADPRVHCCTPKMISWTVEVSLLASGAAVECSPALPAAAPAADEAALRTHCQMLVQQAPGRERHLCIHAGS